MYALVDCNNFYVSCERLFDPTLNGKPVIVLSNNDGCAISRSDEAKAIGIEMGAAPHMIAGLIKKYDVKIFSSNYTLYGDMSERVMKTLSEFVPRMEVYSIDEVFLDLSEMPYTDLLKLGMKMRQKILKNIGIPVCIGIAPTKALSKMANRFAKKRNSQIGVHWAANVNLRNEMLNLTDVGDIWGIGRQHALMLNRNGINSAMDFVKTPEDFVRSKMSVVGLRLQNELKGIPSIAWEFEAPVKKNICSSRSFGSLISDKNLIKQALSNYAANCALKLRQQKSITRELKVFLNTNPHRTGDQQYFRSIVIRVGTPSNSSSVIIKYALLALDIIFKEGYKYMKCGIEAKDLLPEEVVQVNMFSQSTNGKSKSATAALDEINSSLGKDLVRFGIQGFEKKYKARAAHLSPRYTTNILDILKIKN